MKFCRLPNKHKELIAHYLKIGLQPSEILSIRIWPYQTIFSQISNVNLSILIFHHIYIAK
ncbi:hypothetical protein DERF_012031 [Dermatophagoides farinae]|uniref:Uncharacterized protein n=1 Tax=Dermatophagoides farinae TaxID=6954 RepID=A0A922HRD0_DERFA|nr:hypothetical protein DERF_012031 [Dermatophagoides farinae]